jgi:hypothetical protein
MVVYRTTGRMKQKPVVGVTDIAEDRVYEATLL